MSKNRNRGEFDSPLVQQQPAAPERAPLPAPPASPSPRKATWRFKLRPPWPLVDIAIDGVEGGEDAAKAELLRQMAAAIVSASKAEVPVVKQLTVVEDFAAKFSDGSSLALPAGAIVTPKKLVLDKETNDDRLIDAPEQEATVWQVSIPGQRRVVAWRKGFGWTRVRQEIEMLRCDLERAARNQKPKLFPHHEPLASGSVQ